MIIEGRRYQGFEMHKERGANYYFIAFPDPEWRGDHYEYTIVCPLGSKVTAEDIQAEYASGTLGRIPFCTTRASSRYLQESCYPVSWAKTPEYWRARILYELMYYDIVHPGGSAVAEARFRDMSREAMHAFRLEALNLWLLRANWFLTGYDQAGIKYEIDYEHAKRIFMAVKGILLPVEVKQCQFEKANQNFIQATKGIEIAKMSVNNQIEQLRDLAYNNEKIALDFLRRRTEHEVVKKAAEEAFLSVLIGFFQYPKELTSVGNGDELPAVITG
jgi:hypothetical protein